MDSDTPDADDSSIDVVDLDHVAIRVGDLERALAFYHDLLGMPIRDLERYEAGEVPYVAVVAGGRHLHLVPTETDEDDRSSSAGGFEVGGDHVCLLLRSSRVDPRADIDALLERLRDEGVTVESEEPRKRYGAYGRAWAAYVKDPDGRRVELKVH